MPGQVSQSDPRSECPPLTPLTATAYRLPLTEQEAP